MSASIESTIPTFDLSEEIKRVYAKDLRVLADDKGIVAVLIAKIMDDESLQTLAEEWITENPTKLKKIATEKKASSTEKNTSSTEKKASSTEKKKKLTGKMIKDLSVSDFSTMKDSLNLDATSKTALSNSMKDMDDPTKIEILDWINSLNFQEAIEPNLINEVQQDAPTEVQLPKQLVEETKVDDESEDESNDESNDESVSDTDISVTFNKKQPTDANEEQPVTGDAFTHNEKIYHFDKTGKTVYVKNEVFGYAVKVRSKSSKLPISGYIVSNEPEGDVETIECILSGLTVTKVDGTWVIPKKSSKKQ